MLSKFTPREQSRIGYLASRIERADDFDYDDEQVELNNLLSKHELTWKWDGLTVKVIAS